MDEWLKSQNLAAHAEKLKAAGFDTLEKLARITAPDAKAAGLLAGHAKKVSVAAKQLLSKVVVEDDSVEGVAVARVPRDADASGEPPRAVVRESDALFGLDELNKMTCDLDQLQRTLSTNARFSSAEPTFAEIANEVDINAIMTDPDALVVDGEADYFGDDPVTGPAPPDVAAAAPDDTSPSSRASKRQSRKASTVAARGVSPGPITEIRRAAPQSPTVVPLHQNSKLVILNGECGMAPEGTVFHEAALKSKQESIREALRKMEAAQRQSLTIQVLREDTGDRLEEHEIDSTMDARAALNHIVGSKRANSGAECALVECVPSLGLERLLEDFENVSSCQKLWGLEVSSTLQWSVRTHPSRYSLPAPHALRFGATLHDSFAPQSLPVQARLGVRPFSARTARLRPLWVVVHDSAIYCRKAEEKGEEELMFNLADHELSLALDQFDRNKILLNHCFCIRPTRSFDSSTMTLFKCESEDMLTLFILAIRIAKHGILLKRAWETWIPPAAVVSTAHERTLVSGTPTATGATGVRASGTQSDSDSEYSSVYDGSSSGGGGGGGVLSSFITHQKLMGMLLSEEDNTATTSTSSTSDTTTSATTTSATTTSATTTSATTTTTTTTTTTPAPVLAPIMTPPAHSSLAPLPVKVPLRPSSTPPAAPPRTVIPLPSSSIPTTNKPPTAPPKRRPPSFVLPPVPSRASPPSLTDPPAPSYVPPPLFGPPQ